MKLIIDIPDDDYKFIKDLHGLIIGGRGSCKTIQQNVINAIKNGTPVKQCKFCKHCGDVDYCSDCHSDYSLFEE